MHTNDHNKLDPSVLAEMGYEKRDLDIIAIAKVAGYFFIFTAGSVFLSFMFFLIPGVVPNDKAPRPITKIAPPPGTPIIQNNSNNTEDIADLRKKEQAILDGSGPSAKDPGFYYIPVSQAMELIKERGLPSSAVDDPAPAPAPARRAPGGGLAAPTVPNPAGAPGLRPGAGVAKPKPGARAPGAGAPAPAVTAPGVAAPGVPASGVGITKP